MKTETLIEANDLNAEIRFHSEQLDKISSLKSGIEGRNDPITFFCGFGNGGGQTGYMKINAATAKAIVDVLWKYSDWQLTEAQKQFDRL